MNRIIKVPGSEAVACEAGTHSRSGILRVSQCAWLAIVSLSLLYPVAINRFPIVFPDDGAYIGGWFHYPAVPVYYTAFVFLATTLLPMALWVVVALQSAAVAWATWMFLKSTGRLSEEWMLPAVAIACVANQAPWLAATLMPDILSGVGALLLITLLLTDFGGKTVRLGMWALAAFCALVATSNVMVFLPLSVLLMGLRKWIAPASRLQWRAVSLFAVGVVMCSIAPNNAMFRKATLGPASSAFLFSREVDAGVAQPFLRKHCPSYSAVICPLLPQLDKPSKVHQRFLWGGSPSMADTTNAFADPTGDYARASKEIALSHPLALIGVGLRDSWKLALKPVLGGVNELVFQPAPGRAIAARAPELLDAYNGSLQPNGKLHGMFPALLFRFTTYGSYAALALMGIAAFRSGDRTSAALVVVFFAFFALSILDQGGLVGVFPRYHAKVAWLAPVICIAIASRKGQWRFSRQETVTGPADE
jgi:hypothetical protein